MQVNGGGFGSGSEESRAAGRLQNTALLTVCILAEVSG